MKQVELSHGDLRFPALMAGEGETVLLLHGFPDSYRNWQQQLEALADAGYCAIAPALRGYAPDCQPRDGDYSLRAAVEDVLAFAAQLGGPVHLVGHDWGAVVAHLAAVRSPELFRSCSMLAIAPVKRLPAALLKVPEQLLRSGYMGFFQLPLVPEWLLRRNGLAGVKWLWRRWSLGWDPADHLDEAYRTLAQPGVLTAALGWYRHLPRVWTGSNRQARSWLASPARVPTMVLLGMQDGCMSHRLIDDNINLKDFPAGLRVEKIAGVGHFLHLEKPERINDLLLAHLRQYSGDCN